MNNDPRQFGGQEYAPQVHAQPVMRPAPQAVDPHQYAQAIAAPPPAPPPVMHEFATSPPAAASPPSSVSTAAVAAVASDPATSHDDGSEVVTLSRDYHAHDLTIRTLRFRKPTGLDLRKYGYPVRNLLNPETGRVESVEINAAIAHKYAVALSSPPIPPSTLDAMDVHDADACYGAAVRFFLR